MPPNRAVGAQFRFQADSPINKVDKADKDDNIDNVDIVDMADNVDNVVIPKPKYSSEKKVRLLPGHFLISLFHYFIISLCQIIICLAGSFK